MTATPTDLYRIRIAGWGIESSSISESLSPNLKIRRAGEVINPRTDKRESENHIWIEASTTYEEGFEQPLDELLNTLKLSESLTGLFAECAYVELQIFVSLDDENHVPSIHLSPDQVRFLSQLGAHVDIDII